MKNYLLFLSMLCIFCCGCEKATEIKTKDVTKEQEAEILFFINTETNTLETNLYEPTTITYDTQRQLMNCKHVDVAHEVAKALAHKDDRMLAILGVGLIIPGEKENKEVYATYTKTYGFKIIEGTSDSYSDGEDLLLQVNAYDYAKAYNRLMFSKVSSSNLEKSILY